MEGGCDTDHYMVVAKVRERLDVSKRKPKMYNREIKRNEIESKDQYQAKIL
jgi:hypothetical protein